MSPKCDVVIVSFPDNVGMLNMSDVWLKAEQGTGNSKDASRGDDDEGKRESKTREEEKEQKNEFNEFNELEEEQRDDDGNARDGRRNDNAREDSDDTKTKKVECNLSYLVKGFHTGTITAIASCARKPLIITCSKEDKSIRLWNYRTHVCVDALTFENDAQRPLSVDIHPSGHLVLAVFSGRIHLYHVRLDGLRYSREILVKGARMAKFNGHGGLIAVACSRRLEIYRTYTEQCVGGFTGHSMPITSFAWHEDDMSIVSCAMDGSVYEWSLSGLDGTGHTPCGTRAGEHHCGMPTGSGFSYNTVVCGANGSVVVSGAVQGSLKANRASTTSSKKENETKTTLGFGSSASSRNDGTGGNSKSNALVSSSSSSASSEHRMLRGWSSKHLEGKGFVCPTSSTVTSCIVQSDHIIVANTTGTLIFYDYPLKIIEKAGTSSPHQTSITAMALSPDNQIIFTGGADGTIIISEVKSMSPHHTDKSSSSTSSSSYNAATGTRPYLDEIICLTDIQEQEAIQGRIADLEASIIDIQGTWRYEKRETLKKHNIMVHDADVKLAQEKKLSHEQEIELKRLLRASESEGKAKSDAKESQHMETAKLLEDLYDRKLVMKQEELRDTQIKLRDLIVRHEDARVKQKNEIDHLLSISKNRETSLKKKFSKEKKQMEQYIQFVKERYEDTALQGEDMHDVELLKERQSFESERRNTELKMQTTQGEIVLLKKSASMMKESLDEEKQRADMARADKMSCERKMKTNLEKMVLVQSNLKKSNHENQLKDEQIKSHLRRVRSKNRKIEKMQKLRSQCLIQPSSVLVVIIVEILFIGSFLFNVFSVKMTFKLTQTVPLTSLNFTNYICSCVRFCIHYRSVT